MGNGNTTPPPFSFPLLPWHCFRAALQRGFSVPFSALRCMVDSKIPGSRARFIRHKRNVLRFVVEAFVFKGVPDEVRFTVDTFVFTRECQTR